ncbi:isochorismatase family protein [Dickeya dadantii]|uniref:isochorismatase family protein n=1 Tax=Dickeya dadantii TaxID=204038 RepID=UPI001CF270F6|nr:isochorismatase family protein [Dickeya dadantii]MCA7014967.1 isochorismatase family protein [Dickeya dadantii]
MEQIAAYSLPQANELPRSAADWCLDRSRAALLIHDMQRYFLDFFSEKGSPISSVIENSAQILAMARQLGIPVFYTAQPGGMTQAQRGLLQSIWGPGMQASETQRQVIPPLAPAAGEAVLTKWRYSAFFNSDFLARLRELHRDQLIICGVYAHVGCLCTAIDAYSHDIETFFIADAVADFSKEKHQMALNMAAEICSVVLSTRQAISALDKAN